MNRTAVAPQFWSTSSFGDAADTQPGEVTALRRHMDMCLGLRGRLFSLHCLAETLNTHLASRFVTTLVVVTLLIGASSLVS